jgi:CIC family chloride channel protein
VTFTIEEVVGDLDQTVLSGVVIAAAVAAVVERSVLGTHPVFEVPRPYALEHPSSLLFYALLGVVAAGVSIVFTDSLLSARVRFQKLERIPAWARPAVGGLVTGILAVPAVYFLHSRGILGGGYDTMSQALSGKLALNALLVMAALKLAATVFSYSSGGAGGIFAPVLFIGAMVGGSIGVLDSAAFGHSTDQLGAFALVGMGAVFAGVIRAPITSVLIIFELTGGYGLVLPLMIANMTAYAAARRWRPLPVYDALLAQDGIQLPHGPGAARLPGSASPAPAGEQPLKGLKVGDLTAKAEPVPGILNLGSLTQRLVAAADGVLPVVDSEGRLRGLVFLDPLRDIWSERDLEGVVVASDVARSVRPAALDRTSRRLST